MRIAFSGKVAAGKTTAATVLAGLGYERYSLATPLKAFGSAIADWLRTHSLLQEDDYRMLTDKSTIKGRLFLQNLGTEISRGMILPDLWERVLLHRVGSKPDVVVDDLRFRSEATALSEADFLLVRIDVPEPIRLARIARLYPGQEATAEHRSENELDNLDLWHRVFMNNKSKDEFEDDVMTWAKGVEGVWRESDRA